MAESLFESEQHFSESFVESAGAVVFNLLLQTVCVLRHLELNEYVLPKGRRNCGESRRRTAIREIKEETGISCRLLKVNMITRAPPAVEKMEFPDQARHFDGIVEPFAFQYRRLSEGNVKVIWWYIAAVNEDRAVDMELQESDNFMVEFFDYTEVLEKLTYQLDRDMVKKALDIVINTYGA